MNISVTHHTDPKDDALSGSLYTFPDGWRVFDVESARHRAWLYFFKPDELPTTKGQIVTAYLLRSDGSTRFVESSKQADKHLAVLAAQFPQFQPILNTRV